jgi:PAS domain S-box-containing protein
MKTVNHNQESSLDSLAFLSGTAIKFASSGIGDSIFQFIGASLRELNPNAIIIVNSIDPERETSTTEVFLSPPNLLESIISTLGFKPVGKVYKFDSSILELNSGFIRKFDQGIHELSFRTIPIVVSKSLERLVNLGSIYGIAFIADNKMFANAALIFRKGDTLAHQETIETFVRQASVTLKRIEAERSEDKYKSLFEHMTQGAFNMRSDGKITDVNRVALELLGFDKVDFLSKTNRAEDWDLIDENHKSISAKEFPVTIALTKGEPVYEKIIGVFNPIRKDYVWLLINAIPQFKPGNKAPTSVFVTFQDITTIKRSIHKVMDSEANARAIMESTDDVIILLDPNGVVIDSNKAHANRLNIERENLIGKNVFDLLPQDVGRTRKEAIKEVIQTGKPVRKEDFRDGFWNEYSIHPIVSHRGKVERVAVFSKDITEKKKAEEHIRNNYSLLRIAGETAKFGGWIVDIEKNIVIWSDVVAKIHEVEPGFSPSVEEGIHFYAPEWREKITEIFSNCVKNGTPYDEEMEIITLKGKRVWVRTTGEAVKDHKGKTIKIHGAFQDISEYKKISDALIAYERKFKSSIDSLLDAFGMYTAIRDKNNNITDFKIDYVNPKACELNKMSKEEQIGKGLCEILPSHHSSGLFDEYIELVETGNVIEKESVAYQDTYSGELIKRTFEIKASKFSDGFIATWRDISARKQTEEKLLESEREKASLIDNLPGFVYKCAFDHQWTMLYISEECYKITGYHPEDFIFNKKISYNDIIHTDFREAIWSKWQIVISLGTPFREEYQIVTADNHLRWVWEQGRGVYSKEGVLTHLEGFITDITERKEMEEAVRESEARLVELNATKDKFFSILAHDLKSPFNSIIGIGELLIEQIKKKEFADIEEYASIMRDSSHKAINLLTNLLEWSRSQTGRMDFNPEFLRLSQLADEVVDLLNYTANQKSITIHSQIPNSAVCYADKAMISSVLRNLVSNAIKFTGKGGEIVVSAKLTEDKCIVTVSDNGIGMSKSEIDNLFRIDKFYSTRGTENEGGTGLGLILCKEFITRHSCEIWADSKKGEGSSFSFSLPRDSR